MTTDYGLRTTDQGLNGNFLNDSAFGRQRFVGRVQVELDGLANVLPGLFEAIAFGDAGRKSRDEDGVAAFIRRFEVDFEKHGYIPLRHGLLTARFPPRRPRRSPAELAATARKPAARP